MSEINSLKAKIHSNGTLEQIDLFRDLPQHQKTLTIFRYLDGYAQARAYKYLPDKLRTEEIYESLICDKNEAFPYIFYDKLQDNPEAQDEKIIQNFENFNDEEKLKAFNALPEKSCTFTNLSKLPEKDQAFAFEDLNKNEKTAENWLQLPCKFREQSVSWHRVSKNTSRFHKATKQYLKKKALLLLGLLAGIFIALIGIALITLYIFCPPVAALINFVIGSAYSLIVSCVVGTCLTLAGILIGFFCIKNFIQVSKCQKQLMEKYNECERNSTIMEKDSLLMCKKKVKQTSPNLSETAQNISLS